jgi:hypothetical protein
MPRGRDIKPGFFISDELAEVSRDCRLLFIGLWTIADREGRLELRPARIKAQVFPYDADVTPEGIGDMLTLLSTCRGRFLELYEVSGCRYVLIRNFKKHQHIHPNEKPSALPCPTCVPVISGKATDRSGNSALPSVPSSLHIPTRGGLRPDSTYNLKWAIKTAVQKAQPQIGQWVADGFADRDGDAFFSTIEDVEKAIPEIQRKIGIFAADPEMSPWNVGKFTKEYNRLGVAKQQRPGQPTGRVVPIVER